MELPAGKHPEIYVLGLCGVLNVFADDLNEEEMNKYFSVMKDIDDWMQQFKV